MLIVGLMEPFEEIGKIEISRLERLKFQLLMRN